jgi:hypothetical protein
MTCRHFRKGVAGGLGVCGLDPRHPALTGYEMRACWSAAPAPAEPGSHPRMAVGPGRAPGAGLHAREPRTFVPVEASGPANAAAPVIATGTGTTEAAVARAAPLSPATGVGGRVPGMWWLWGDPDPWSDL